MTNQFTGQTNFTAMKNIDLPDDFKNGLKQCLQAFSAEIYPWQGMESQYKKWHSYDQTDFELSIDPNLPYWYELKNGKYVGMEKIQEKKDYDTIPKSQLNQILQYHKDQLNKEITEEDAQEKYGHLDHHMKTAVFEAF